MRRLFVLGIGVVAVSACSPALDAGSKAIPPTPEPTVTPEAVAFATIPDNDAAGEAAVDFEIILIDGQTFNLSDWRDVAHRRRVLPDLVPGALSVPGAGRFLKLVLKNWRENNMSGSGIYQHFYGRGGFKVIVVE